MELSINPFVGVGPIRFGMLRNEVRAILGSGFREFRKTPQATATTDDFTDLDLHVYYDETDHCKAVEMFPSAKPTLNGRQLVGESFRRVFDFLQKADNQLERVDSGLRSKQFGIALYVPNADRDADAPVESVYIFRKGIFGT